MTAQLLKLWRCWISDRTHRKPLWKTWIRLLAGMPKIADQAEDDAYYRIYKERIDNGQYKSESVARGKWVRGQWLMRSTS